jgi:hypothetical protein
MKGLDDFTGKGNTSSYALQGVAAPNWNLLVAAKLLLP